MKSQASQPQSAQGLRQSLERELQQQVTQLEVSAHATICYCSQLFFSSKHEIGITNACGLPGTKTYGMMHNELRHPAVHALFTQHCSLGAINATCTCLDGCAEMHRILAGHACTHVMLIRRCS